MDEKWNVDETKIELLFKSWEEKPFLRLGALVVNLFSWRHIFKTLAFSLVPFFIIIYFDLFGDLFFLPSLGFLIAMIPRLIPPSLYFRTKFMEYGNRKYYYNTLNRVDYCCEDEKEQKGKHLMLHFDEQTIDVKLYHLSQEEKRALLQLFNTCFKPVFVNKLFYADIIRLFADVIAMKSDSDYQNVEFKSAQKYFEESKYRDLNYYHDLSQAIHRFNMYKSAQRLPGGEGYMNICLSIVKNKSVDYADRLDLLSHLFECMYASDGMVDESELERLSRIAFYLRIKEWDFLSLKYRFEAEKQSKDQQKGSENTQQRERYQSVCSNRKREAYNLLGLKADAPLEEVKSAYRTQVKNCHPDTLPPTATEEEREEATLRFRTITEAYDFLCAELSAEPVSVAK